MANIGFIRTYEFYGSEWCDIGYDKDGYIHRCVSYPVAEMPKTAQKWLKTATGITQYNNVYQRDEVIYKRHYKYGMRSRGYSIGCQPMKGLTERIDDPSGRYYDILVYDRQLPDTELEDYELDYIGEE